MATSVFARAPRAEAMSQINITPLVDVMLVLLVIFMISAPMLTGNLDMRLPQTPETALPTPPPPKILLQVQADGSFVLDGQYLGQAALTRALTDVARGAPNTVVAIQADPDADYQAFTAALSATRAGGIANIALGN